MPHKKLVDSLRQKGAVFVEELGEIPDTDVPVIFSAHGVPKSVPAEAGRAILELRSRPWDKRKRPLGRINERFLPARGPRSGQSPPSATQFCPLPLMV